MSLEGCRKNKSQQLHEADDLLCHDWACIAGREWDPLLRNSVCEETMRRDRQTPAGEQSASQKEQLASRSERKQHAIDWECFWYCFCEMKVGTKRQATSFVLRVATMRSMLSESRKDHLLGSETVALRKASCMPQFVTLCALTRIRVGLLLRWFAG